MKQKIRRIITAFEAALVFVASVFAAFADENAATLDLPISVQVYGAESGTVPTVSFALTAKNDGPMPAGAEDGVYRFSVKGSGTVTIEIVCTETGAWEYELSAKTSAGKVTPDKLIVTIQVIDEGGVLTALVVAETEDGKKCDLAFRVDVDSSGPTPPTPITGDDSKLGLYIAAAGISLILIIVLTVYLIGTVKRRKRK